MPGKAVIIENLWKKYALGGSTSLSLREAISSIFHKRTANSNKEFWALQNVNFEIESGEAVGIIGKNGAGKSTLLKVLSQITFPTMGRIVLNGRVSSLLEVGTGFHPELSGKENIYLNGTILGMSRSEVRRKFEEIVAFAGVEKFIDTPVKHYSSGMYVRLAFSVAAHLEPEILIIDEVLAVGDAEFQKKCLGKMDEVVNQGRTVIFVSHNMNAVSELCSRCLVISQGKLVYDSDNVSESIGYYLNLGMEKTVKQYLLDCDGEYENDIHTLDRISLVNHEGQILKGVIPNTERIILRIEGRLFENDPSFNLGFILYNQRHQKIMSSWLKDAVLQNSSISNGEKIDLKVEFPPFFFNKNHYRIEIITVLHNIKFLIKSGEGPSMDFAVTGGRSDEMITPQLSWKPN